MTLPGWAGVGEPRGRLAGAIREKRYNLPDPGVHHTSCDDVMNANNKEEFCSDRQERCGDAFLNTDDFKCCGGGEGGLECADRPAIVTQCSPALRGALMAINQSQMTTCARAHNVNIGIKRRPAAEPPQVPVLSSPGPTRTPTPNPDPDSDSEPNPNP